MSKVRTVQKYTQEAIKRRDQMSRENYKKVKHMDKAELVNYITRVWNDGYTAGLAAAKEHAAQEKESEG